MLSTTFVLTLKALMPDRESSPVGPFEQHLRDAIALNRERAPRYAALSRGASLAISRRLIAAEYMLLPVARWFDRRADPYHRAGVPLLESLFTSMSEVPKFAAVASAGGVTSVGFRLRTAPIRRRVEQGFRDGGFPSAAAVLERERAGLAASSRRNYLVRHLLESAHRLAVLAPVHERLALERGLPSPVPLLTRLFRLHLWGLGHAATLDWRAIPLQDQGIAILAQDLPPIVLPGQP